MRLSIALTPGARRCVPGSCWDSTAVFMASSSAAVALRHIGRWARFAAGPRAGDNGRERRPVTTQVGAAGSALRLMAGTAAAPLRSAGEEACGLGRCAATGQTGPGARGRAGRVQPRLADPGAPAAEPALRRLRTRRAAGAAAGLAPIPSDP